jgi:hypothetical protein
VRSFTKRVRRSFIWLKARVAFQMHDADGDGDGQVTVTEAEMAAMAAMMQNHMGGRQGDMPGAGHGMMGSN